MTNKEIQERLKQLGITLSANQVNRVLKTFGLKDSRELTEDTWNEFVLKANAHYPKISFDSQLEQNESIVHNQQVAIERSMDEQLAELEQLALAYPDWVASETNARLDEIQPEIDAKWQATYEQILSRIARRTIKLE